VRTRHDDLLRRDSTTPEDWHFVFLQNFGRVPKLWPIEVADTELLECLEAL